jgi:hypothetical protein
MCVCDVFLVLVGFDVDSSAAVSEVNFFSPSTAPLTAYSSLNFSSNIMNFSIYAYYVSTIFFLLILNIIFFFLILNIYEEWKHLEIHENVLANHPARVTLFRGNELCIPILFCIELSSLIIFRIWLECFFVFLFFSPIMNLWLLSVIWAIY